MNQAKGETLHHTFRKQKLDVEKQEPQQYLYKTRKESLPQSTENSVKWFVV